MYLASHELSASCIAELIFTGVVLYIHCLKLNISLYGRFGYGSRPGADHDDPCHGCGCARMFCGRKGNLASTASCFCRCVFRLLSL